MTSNQCICFFIRCGLLFCGIQLSSGRSALSKDSMSGGDIILSSVEGAYKDRHRRDTLEHADIHIIQKRQIIIPNNFRNKLWDMPVKYKIDPAYSEKNVNTIKKALKQWETDTCLRFQKISFNEPIDDYHLIFEKALTCSSDLGRTPGRGPKFIKLSEESCKPFFGFVLHQMGHVLGFLHEQSRSDAEKYVTVFENNIKERISLFLPWPNPNAITSHGVPYDYGSVMQYEGSALSKSGKITIKANDPQFQKAMGQRVGLSFYDTKKTNLAYCKDSCPKPMNCERGGLPNPQNCKVCICPDGYGGTRCETVGASDAGCTPNTNSIIKVSSANEECLESPHYGNGVYAVESKCNWILQAPEGRHIQLHFSGDFSMLETETMTCFHWVEIKYKKNLDIGGPRFCGKETPKDVLTTEGNQAVISFRSNYEAPASFRGGFRLCYKLKTTGTGNTPSPTTPASSISTTKAPTSCPSGLVYSPKATCRVTCKNPKTRQSCKKPQDPGCVCPNGRILFRGKCIRRKFCRCVDSQDQIRKKGESWLTTNCRRKTTCLSRGRVRKQEHKCPTGYKCVTKKGFGTCVKIN